MVYFKIVSNSHSLEHAPNLSLKEKRVFNHTATTAYSGMKAKPKPTLAKQQWDADIKALNAKAYDEASVSLHSFVHGQSISVG
jgi:hypothetical protein